jgi:hypothetical protein
VAIVVPKPLLTTLGCAEVYPATDVTGFQQKPLSSLTNTVTLVNATRRRRFRFTLRDEDNIRFNWSIVVNIMYLKSEPVLHVVDEATSYESGRFMNGDVSAKNA